MPRNAFAVSAPRWGSLQRSPDPLAGFGDGMEKGREGKGRGMKRGKEGKRREGWGWKGEGQEGKVKPPSNNSGYTVSEIALTISRGRLK